MALLLAGASEGNPQLGVQASSKESVILPSSVPYTSVLEGLLLDKITGN